MNHLYSALRKCHHNQEREWCGYLLPQEILAIRDLGTMVDCEKRYVDTAIDWKRKGHSNGTWFYFQVARGRIEEFKTLKKDLKHA